MKINGCSLIYIEAEKVGGIKAVSVENWWGIWKRQRKSADTQIQKYKSQIHKYEDQGCISWWLVRNLEDAEEVKEMHFLPKRHFTYIWITPIV